MGGAAARGALSGEGVLPSAPQAADTQVTLEKTRAVPSAPKAGGQVAGVGLGAGEGGGRSSVPSLQ